MADINNLNTNDELPAFARREDDTELHAISVWNAVPPLRTYFSMEDPDDPADPKEARDVAEVCMMVGMPIHARVFKVAGRRLPNIRRRRFYSTQPVSESKRNCRNYGHARDVVCNAANQRHSLMNHASHALDAYLASRHGIPVAGIVPPMPDPEELQEEIATLRQQLAAATNGAPNAATQHHVANLQHQLAAANAQVATLQQQLTTAGNSNGTQVLALQQQLATANNQAATLVQERDDARRRLADANNDLTTVNGQLARVLNERDTANVEVTRLMATENAIRTGLGGQIQNLIEASPSLQAAGHNTCAVAREIVNAIDLDRLTNNAVNTPRADRGGGGDGGGDGGMTGV